MWHITVTREWLIIFHSLLFAELTLLWAISNYAVWTDLVPGIDSASKITQVNLRENKKWLLILLCKGSVCAGLAGKMSGWHSWSVPVFILIATTMFPLFRSKTHPKYIAEYELIASALFILGLAFVILRSASQLQWTPIQIEASNSNIVAVPLIASTIIFSMRGGTYMVRGDNG